MTKFLFTIILFSAAILSAQTEEDFDQEFLGNDNASVAVEKKSKWEIGGFLQGSYQQAIPLTGSDYRVVKIEERGRIDADWTYGAFSAKAKIDAFYYPRQVFENSEPHNRIDVPEVYLQGGEKFQFKLGIQKFTWGSCELFRLTRYFSRYDLSEFIAKDTDDISKGVGALTLKYIFKDFSLEAVWSPFHYPITFPRGFWELKDTKPYQSEFLYSDSLDYDIANSSAGLRFGGTVKGVDLFLSYFNGYSSNAFLYSTLYGSDIGPEDDLLSERYAKVYRENRIEYFRVNSIGFELSTVIKKFTLKFETVFTPDMVTAPAVTDGTVNNVIANLPEGDSSAELTQKERVPYFAYSVGSDANLWGRYGLILVEWTQGIYFKNISRYSYPATSYLLLVMAQDSFFDKRLVLRGGILLRPISLNPGGLMVLAAAWKFTGKFEISLRGTFFLGNDDPLFEFYEGKHLLELKARYTF